MGAQDRRSARVRLWFTFNCFIVRDSLRSDEIWGTGMDSAALQELIALARDTAAELAAAEKKVSAFKDELAHQDQLNARPTMSHSITINPKRSGWIPEDKLNTNLSARPPKAKSELSRLEPLLNKQPV
jgi:hypothetical protein